MKGSTKKKKKPTKAEIDKVKENIDNAWKDKYLEDLEVFSQAELNTKQLEKKKRITKSRRDDIDQHSQ